MPTATLSERQRKRAADEKQAKAAVRLTIKRAKKEARKLRSEKQTKLLRKAERRPMFNYIMGAEFEKSSWNIVKDHVPDMVLPDGTRFGDVMLADGRYGDDVFKLLLNPPIKREEKQAWAETEKARKVVGGKR